MTSITECTVLSAGTLRLYLFLSYLTVLGAVVKSRRPSYGGDRSSDPLGILCVDIVLKDLIPEPQMQSFVST